MLNTTDPQSGFILIDKPARITSHDVVDVLRRLTGIKKIGHAGTLDPFATGLLIIAIGRETTREISKFVGMDKTYEAQIVLGATTVSLDTETEVIFNRVGAYGNTPLRRDEIENAMKKLTGEIDQIPPMHSAIKVGGKRLYKSARKGEEVRVEPRKIRVKEFTMIEPKIPQVSGRPVEQKTQIISAHIKCSSGTYVRALARDLAAELGTVGYLRNLKRTSIGKFELQNAIKLKDLTANNWQILVKSLKEMAIDEKAI